MPDKLTDNEIKKALQEMVDYPNYYEKGQMLKNVLDLINRQEDKCKAYKHYYDECLKDLKTANAENENLKADVERLKKTVDIHKGIAEDWKHEAKKLQMVIDEVDDYIHPLPFETDYDKAIKQAKAEAYKECIEKANEIIDLIVDLMFDGNVSKCQLPSCHKPSSIPCESEICIQENKEYWHSKLDNLLKELVGEDK